MSCLLAGVLGEKAHDENNTISHSWEVRAISNLHSIVHYVVFQNRLKMLGIITWNGGSPACLDIFD